MGRSTGGTLNSLVLLATLALASCSSSGESAPTTSPASPSNVASTPATRAEAACRAVDSEHFYSGEPATLGEARGWTVGTGFQTLETALSDTSGSSFVAWCWFNTGGFYESMIADENGHSVSTGITSNSPPPPGAPDVP
jgi:hypothetical protein